jgi:nucleolar protein 16
MAGPRKRRTIRNPSKKVSRVQKHKFDISFQGSHPLVQKNWDKKLTLKQNYEKMGLTAQLGGYAGGTDHDFEVKKNHDKRMDMVKAEVEWRSIDDIQVREVKQETIEGDIRIDKRVLRIGTKLNHTIDVESDLRIVKEKTEIIAEMEKESKLYQKVSQYQSEQETMVFEELIAKHGDDYAKMSRDIKLNKYQLSAGQIKRKLLKTIAR